MSPAAVVIGALRVNVIASNRQGHKVKAVELKSFRLLSLEKINWKRGQIWTRRYKTFFHAQLILA